MKKKEKKRTLIRSQGMIHKAKILIAQQYYWTWWKAYNPIAKSYFFLFHPLRILNGDFAQKRE